MPGPHSSASASLIASVSRPELGIAIVSHNTRGCLRECLRSLRDRPPGTPHRVTVVDNASTDGSADMVEAEFPAVNLICNAENRGFAAANNQALRQFGTPFALLLNSDCVADGGAIDGMVAFMKSHPDAGMVGCRLVDTAGRPQASAGRLPGLGTQALSFFQVRRLVPGRVQSALAALSRSRRLVDRLTAGYFTPAEATEPLRVQFISGACLAVRRATWEQIGLLDDAMFLYLEDVDWCRRAAEAGWSLYYVPDLSVVHVGGQSLFARTGGTYHLSDERLRSALYYFRKHEPRWRVVALRVIMFTAVTWRAVARRAHAASEKATSRFS